MPSGPRSQLLVHSVDANRLAVDVRHHLLSAQADDVGVDVQLSGQPARGQTLLNATVPPRSGRQCAECLPHRS